MDNTSILELLPADKQYTVTYHGYVKGRDDLRAAGSRTSTGKIVGDKLISLTPKGKQAVITLTGAEVVNKTKKGFELMRNNEIFLGVVYK